MLEQEIVVTKITLALFMPEGQGRPIHKDRKTHGLVYNVGCTSSYRFEGGKTLLCRDGECLFLPKGCNYTTKRCNITDSKDSGVYAINFLTLSDEHMDTPWVMKIKREDEVTALFSKAALAWTKKEVGFYEECLSDLYRVIRQIKRESAQYFSKQTTMSLLAPALQYINEHYVSEAISVSHLAGLCGVSEVYLRRAFQHAFAVSPAVYMRNRRIRYAKELLQTGDYSVTDAAMLAGFNDTAYFAREFKKVVGVTPSAYRKETETRTSVLE